MVHIDTDDHTTQDEDPRLRSLSRAKRESAILADAIITSTGIAIAVSVNAAEATYVKEREALERIEERMGDKGLSDVKEIIGNQIHALDTQQTHTRIMEGIFGAIEIAIILLTIVFLRRVKRAISEAQQAAPGVGDETTMTEPADEPASAIPKQTSESETGGATIIDIRSARKTPPTDPSTDVN